MIDDPLVFDRIQVFKSQIFQFGFELVKSKTVGERRVDVEGFLGDNFALLGFHVLQGPHIVQAVRNFNHDDPRGLCHRADEFAIGFRLLLDFISLLLHGGNFCYGIYHKGGVFTKSGFDFFKSVRSVFDDIVQ